MFDLETQIHSWSDHLRAHGNFSDADILELEDHLRDEIEDLIAAGLTPDESFLISVKRLGNVDAISNEFAKVNTENLWRQLLVEPADSLGKQQNRRDIVLVVIFALLAGTLFKIPEIFGWSFQDSNSGVYKIFGFGFENQTAESFFLKNFSIFILPFIAAFFLIKRKAESKTWAVILGIFAISGLIVNVYPAFAPNDTGFLTSFHLPLFLWLVVGAAYIGKEWKGSQGRMNFFELFSKPSKWMSADFSKIIY